MTNTLVVLAWGLCGAAFGLYLLLHVWLRAVDPVLNAPDYWPWLIAVVVGLAGFGIGCGLGGAVISRLMGG